eukprot:SM001151S24266  [mRNA]  locus=s1151:132:1817:+ [translate_table: standard]
MRWGLGPRLAALGAFNAAVYLAYVSIIQVCTGRHTLVSAGVPDSQLELEALVLARDVELYQGPWHQNPAGQCSTLAKLWIFRSAPSYRRRTANRAPPKSDSAQARAVVSEGQPNLFEFKF